jgi:pyruvate, water dikinase
MPDSGRPVEQILRALQERAKELNCLYRVEEALHRNDVPLGPTLREITEALPPGFQYPAHCVPRITFRDLDTHPPDFVETPWVLSAPIEVQGQTVGAVHAYYDQHFPEADEGPFLAEERRLINTIAVRIAQTIVHRELADVFEATGGAGPAHRAGWRVIVELLRRTDQDLYHRLARKTLNQLSRRGVEKARDLLTQLAGGPEDAEEPEDENRPLPLREGKGMDVLAGDTFRVAAEHLGENELLDLLQVWLKEDRVNFLVQALESADTSVAEIANALERYRHTGVHARELSVAMRVGIQVALVRRLLTDQLGFISVCRAHIEIEDFADLMTRIIQIPKSHGKLGGKSSGLFLASRILQRDGQDDPLLRDIRTPRTWYVPSDGLLQFIAHNNLDDVYNWKYQEIETVRQDYPNLVHLFKSSRFPPEYVQAVAAALDDFGDRPLIVRSSSLLEDRAGSAFSGKYKSLFLANQGRKRDRLAALLDAIAEVYASTLGPDPIQYRAERGLLDHHEEMGLMIQEVVGTRIGRYYLPTWAGVALTHNELRWSPRIRRADGLLRLVPGLGTRAVDRLADDYPVLAAPGQPGLRVNVTPEEVARYSPRKIDVINLESNAFETLERHPFLREVGAEYPGLTQLISLYERDHIRRPGLPDLAFDRDNLVFAFEGLLHDGVFIERMRNLLSLLGNSLGYPVDLEFACDGREFYLLQCRQQSHAPDAAPAPIPQNIPPSQLLFSAHRYVTNGAVPDITHIVYVEPDAYAHLPDLGALRDVGRAIGRLNKLLPRKRFVLMGPGRWGSRGDIRLGVSVTYADINNTAVLIEVARKRGHYQPELSFGTHFFQDLVESSIRYLPLYPDEDGAAFQEEFFRTSENSLSRLLPEFQSLADVIRVIDIPAVTGGQVLRVLMNAERDEAVGILGAQAAVESSSAAVRDLATR